ncbi:MAG: type IV toxin-antitoxin system AbiEi family antitoxin [Fibromonadaceae bacterium]|nr:type IV toxin-antitoxin system AbiEi family antitoxin [Fibromonadaceae bacterium]
MPELTTADLVTHQKKIGGLSHASDSTIQRLSYLLEHGKESEGFEINMRWKVIVNEQIEVDDL